MIKERLTFVDTAKFIAIWMVIVSHSCMESDLTKFLFAFHVPMFFFLYGFVYNQKNCNLSVTEYLKSKMPSLFGRVLVPYLLLAFILGEALNLKTLVFVSWGSIQSLSGITSTHLWFLPCYFMAVIIFGIIMTFIRKDKLIMGGGNNLTVNDFCIIK